MKETTIWESLPLPNQAFLVDLEGLYQALQTVMDQRARRGIRYRLPAVLMIGLLAKLAGQNRSRAMAHWAKLRQHALSQLFQLQRQTMPH